MTMARGLSAGRRLAVTAALLAALPALGIRRSAEQAAEVANEQVAVSLATIEEATVRDAPFEQVLAATAPVSTACSWWNSATSKTFYANYGGVCGVAGTGQAALEAHVERVWQLILSAQKQLAPSGVGRNTLYVFTAPEWTFRRYPVGGATYAPPLSFNDMHYILNGLLGRLQAAKPHFDNWLIVPGSIYWGVPIPQRPGYPAGQYAVFNTLPIIYDAKLVFAHNKYNQADNLDTPTEVWGYELMAEFPKSTDCQDYGDAGRICGADAFVAWLRRFEGDDLAQAVMDWGVKQPADAIVVNGLVVGVDICLDHRMTLGHRARAAERLKSLVHVDKFDLQLLVSSGMSFAIPEEDGALSLLLRPGGLALSADGIGGPSSSQLFFLQNQGQTDLWHDAHGAVRLHNNGGLVKLSLKYDFLEIPGGLLGLWGGPETPCPLSTIDVGCGLCKTGRMQLLTTPQNAHTFCSTEAGNWRLLKVWARALPLQAPQPGVSLIVQPGVDGAVAVRHR